MNNTPDSSFLMTKSLFDGVSMHGDIALTEARCSLQTFYHLVNIGIKFPHNEYGSCIGYKSDHDPRINLDAKVIRKSCMDELPQLWTDIRIIFATPIAILVMVVEALFNKTRGHYKGQDAG